MKQFYVYILSNRTCTLYVGVTSNIKRRVYEHKNGMIDGFTKMYNVDRLVYFERFSDSVSAIRREKEIKKWRREKKVELVYASNPKWNDLSEEWF